MHHSRLTYCNGCRLLEDEEELKEQYMDQVERLMGEGRLEGWYPDSDLYEDILALVCEKPTNAKLADEILYDEMEVMP